MVLFVATMSACASVPSATGMVEEGATVRVENHAVLDANVYAVRAGQRIRLGTVTAHTTGTFRVPATLVGSGMGVQFLVDFIGSNRAPVSEEITIWPGEEVTLRIPAA